MTTARFIAITVRQGRSGEIISARSLVNGKRFESRGRNSLHELLTALNRAGHAGRRWHAHDGRVAVAHGYVRDFSYDLKHGRPPTIDWYEANVGTWPVAQDAECRRAQARVRPTRLSPSPPPS